MKKVWIAQLKCPQNHCVCAVAAEIADDQTAQLEAKLWAGFNHLVEVGELIYECGICKATRLHVETKRTSFATLALAVPTLEESQRQQLATATFLRQTRN